MAECRGKEKRPQLTKGGVEVGTVHEYAVSLVHRALDVVEALIKDGPSATLSPMFGRKKP